MFPSYIVDPVNCSFEGQNPDEKILLLLRAHPITNLQWIIPVIFLFFLPFLIPILIPTSLLFFDIDISFLPSAFKILLLIINYLLVAVISFEGFLYWYFNVYIVTDKNIIDIDFYSMLSKNIDVAPLRNIEDTSSSMGGLFNAIFHYGNVTVQTAGSSKNIEFTSVPKPHLVADFILDHTHKIHTKGSHANIAN